MWGGVIFLLISFPLCWSWDPDAGIIDSLTKTSNVRLSASSGQSSVARVLDNDDNTNWVSSYCLPGGYFSNEIANVLHGVCAKGDCKSSGASVDNIGHATDGSVYTVANVHADSTQAPVARLILHVCPAITFRVLTLNGIFHDQNTTLSAVDDLGQRHLVRIFGTHDNYKDIQLSVNFNVSMIQIESHSSFSIKEIAALGPKGCVQQVTVDLRAVKKVGTVRTRHWAGTNNAEALYLKTSYDGSAWVVHATLDPEALRAVTTSFPPVMARYIALEYHVKLANYKKVYCYEIDAWDEHGLYGPPLPVLPQANTVREILGVNGIWGWGHSKYSDALANGEGPTLYNAISSHARNYHNLNWDVRDPDNNPEFQNMAAGHGTNAKWWLNWDKEYRAWKSAGLFVDASIQFTNKSFPQHTWNTPEASADQFGFEFAKHFGSVQGVGLVDAMEVGNEPWDYDASFYATVLKGMAAGAKRADNKIKVLPGAFQAESKHNVGNYIGTRVLQEVANNIDVINSHTYSFLNTPQGVRIGTYPEHHESAFNSVRAIFRWRNANTPSKPVWITEWGWDSSGGNEGCTFSECVTEQAQAVYGARGLMILMRSGVEKATWFFYANTDCSTLFCRSGLTTSNAHNFSKKTVFLVFEELISHIGDKYFLGSLQEHDAGYVYLFGNAVPSLPTNSSSLLQSATHMVAWLPRDITSQDKIQFSTQLSAGTHVGTALKITGGPSGRGTEAFHTFSMSDKTLTVEISTFPVLISLVHDGGASIVGK